MSGEDRGVQVEARTLSGVHIGQRVSVGGRWARLVTVEHDEYPGKVALWLDDRLMPTLLDPTDLVTLTDGGEDE